MGPPSRRARCEDALIAQGVSLRLEINGYCMFDYEFLGSRIRAIRQEKKITQEKLAEAAGVGVTHISHIESGASEPSTTNLVKVARLYGVDPAELLREVEA